MVRKCMITTSVIIAAACLFSGCASRNSERPDWQITEQNQAVILEEKESQISVENLTENTTQGVCIDYSITSYEDVQLFGYELFAQSIGDKNPVLSPVSAYLALSMAGCGADGATLDEFGNVLGDMEVFSDDMTNTFPQNGDTLKISIANSAWIDDEFLVEDAWLGTIKSLMGAEAFQTNLSTQEAMNCMNRWVFDKTNGMIDNMIESPVDSMTRLVLFDAVYFKGKWETPFAAEHTYTEDFFTDRARSAAQQVDMMNLYMTNLDCIANEFAEGVILPYQSDSDTSVNMALIALKPTGNDDIREMYGKLTVEVVRSMLLSRQNERVHLKLPKFEVTFDRELNKYLFDMGLTECFDPVKADFSQMGTTQSGMNLFISLVRQKAKIIVDEEGTEAAAVTEIDMRDGGVMFGSEPRALYFDEPFLYMIMDMDRELPLFIGILDDPKGE
ncbi:MAG: serpin family protein [Lachnospiraceae bacterium]|nr:serpin family protein [Lachnospiraceae bacterium]